MKSALGASISAESAAFQKRVDKADAHTQKESDSIDESTSAAQKVLVPKVMREAFTIPESEHAYIEEVRGALLSQAVAVSKSEVIRAGLLLLREANIEIQKETFERLERVKTGRPKQNEQ